MSRAKRAAQTPAPFVLGVSVDDGTPAELQELAAIVALRGPELLAGRDPAKVGLLAIHPSSPACPEHLRRANNCGLSVVSRAELERFAAGGGLRRRPPPGLFWAVLVGRHQLAGLNIGPVAQGAS